MKKTVLKISEKELVFDQTPLEDSLFRVFTNLGDKARAEDLLNDIYLPLFESDKITKLYFIHG